MMKTEGVAGTQHEFREKLTETIGEVKTDSFYNAWLTYHFTRRDVDSMKAWGFNSVRVALHYKWFTLPIEEEPVPGGNTWLEKGFEMIDSLLAWCADNRMYLILDLHGAPGGQGANADISDYDPSKPSLWESQENKDKTVALWRKLAERYSNEPWIGGYDLINETNWTFPEGNNSQLRALLGEITGAIREVDANHIIFIEGNSYANDFSGLTPPWDDNFVYSFHKYWSGTGPTDLDWVLPLRETHDVPLWLGESGENSNTWYTDLIALCESLHIGWSWWPVKKSSINNVLNVTLNKEYEDLVKYWKGEIAGAPSEEEAFQAVLQWAENHRIENCIVQYDVIDAMIRQPHTDEVLPYRDHDIAQPIFATDFDYGKNNFAYYDKDVGYYGGSWTAWNTGWSYRSDGVDIEVCGDTGPVSNGYNVGWTEEGEWMQYTITVDSEAAYTLDVRSASATGGSDFHLEVNDADITKKLTLPTTGGWQTWQTRSFPGVILPAGELKLKFKFNTGGSNLSYFHFRDPSSAGAIDFQHVSAETSTDGMKVYLVLNKQVSTPRSELNAGEFQLRSDNVRVGLSGISTSESNGRVLILSLAEKLNYRNVLTLAYNGTGIRSDSQGLIAFSGLQVANNLPSRHSLPGRIEAEDFEVNSGFELENCSEGGKNTAYAYAGDYLDYLVTVTRTAYYDLNYRIASEHSNAELIFQVSDGDGFTSLDTIPFNTTGGWQNWSTQSSKVFLEAGESTIRLLVKQGEHNLNWFELVNPTGTDERLAVEKRYSLYPNPGRDQVILRVAGDRPGHLVVKILDLHGKLVSQIEDSGHSLIIPTTDFSSGIYLIQIFNGSSFHTEKLLIR